LENSAKLMGESGCFFLCSSRHVCTKKAYDTSCPAACWGLLCPWRLPAASFFSKYRPQTGRKIIQKETGVSGAVQDQLFVPAALAGEKTSLKHTNMEWNKFASAYYFVHLSSI
jgi:hypothetical protein